MRLDLRFSNRSLEDLWSQAVASLVFQTPDLEKGALWSLNKRMAGSLADLSGRGLWTGARGENLLLATQNAIQAEKVLLHGLGPRKEFDFSVLEAEIRALGSVLNRIGVCDFGIHIPSEGMESQYGHCLELSAIKLIETFFENHKDDPGYFLKIIFSVESNFMDVLSHVVSRLRSHFGLIMDLTIIIDNRVRSQT